VSVGGKQLKTGDKFENGELPIHILRMHYNMRRIGPTGDKWTEQMVTAGKPVKKEPVEEKPTEKPAPATKPVKKVAKKKAAPKKDAPAPESD
jgi:hypothetical protein